MNADPKLKLQTDFPSLGIQSMNKIGEGWDNDAYVVNNELVFRIPKNRSSHMADEQKQHVEVEIEILSRIPDDMPARTPKIQYVAPNNSYYGYKYISGEKVASDLLIKSELQQDFVKKWVDSAVTLEQIQLESAEPFPYNEYRLMRVQQVIESGVLPETLMVIAQKTAQDYMDLWNGVEAVVVHGDFGPGNWLYNSVTGEYAIIDWSDVCLAPQEFQMYRLINDLPESLPLVSDLYRKATGRTINKALLLACGNASILSIIGEQLEKNGPDDEHVRLKINQLKDWVGLQ